MTPHAGTFSKKGKFQVSISRQWSLADFGQNGKEIGWKIGGTVRFKYGTL
jgi:hypothetical protein